MDRIQELRDRIQELRDLLERNTFMPIPGQEIGGNTPTGGDISGSHNSGETRSRPRSLTNNGRPHQPYPKPPSPAHDHYQRPHRHNGRPHQPYPKPPSPAHDHYQRPHRHNDDRCTDNRHRPRDRTPSPYQQHRYTPDRRRHDHSPEPRSSYPSRKN